MDAEVADVIIMWGSNARETHPIFFHHLLKGVNNGARLYTVDPRRTSSAEWSDGWLGIDVGSDIALANALGREILAASPEFTAMAAGNDMLAVGCYAAVEEAGLDCPGDISVVGFNDMPFIDRLRPPMTTVAFPHYQLGTEAASLLLERLSGGEKPAKIVYLAPEFVVRGSTAAPSQAGRTR